jgi:hypothetical protein
MTQAPYQHRLLAMLVEVGEDDRDRLADHSAAVYGESVFAA